MVLRGAIQKKPMYLTFRTLETGANFSYDEPGNFRLPVYKYKASGIRISGIGHVSVDLLKFWKFLDGQVPDANKTIRIKLAKESKDRTPPNVQK